MSRLTAVDPLGLITAPNEYGQYPPGAMSKALNVAFRRLGVMSGMPGTVVYRTGALGSGYTVRGLFPDDASVLTIGNNGSSWQAYWNSSSASTAISMPSGFTLGFDTGKCRSHRTRDRRLIATNAGVLALDGEGATTARCAGLPPPRTFFLTSSETIGAQSMPDGTVAGFCAIFRRIMTDGYELRSPPSMVLNGDNDSGSLIDPVAAVTWSSDFGIQAGDLVEVYRTTQQAIGIDPGADYYLDSTHEIDATDITNGYATIRLTSTDAALGTELYTNADVSNPGVTGNAASFPPPLACDAVDYKGYTFYVSEKTVAAQKIRIPGAVGSLSTAAERTSGIGSRSVTGDTTSGSPTITSVSDMTGIVVGQKLVGTGFSGLRTVTAVGASSITVDANASASGTGVTFTVSDVLEVAGVSIPIGSPEDLVLHPSSYLGEAIAILSNPLSNLAYTIVSSSVNGIEVEYAAPLYFTTQNVSIRGTNGQNYSPPIPDIADTAKDGLPDTRQNRIHYSALQQPETVPQLNYFWCGHGTIYRLISTRDCIYAFCSDGLYRISGDAGDWRVDPVDPSLVLAARAAVASLNDDVYAYTNRGLVSISNDVVQEITTKTIAELRGAQYSDTWNTFLACDQLHDEVWLTFGVESNTNSTSYVLNHTTGKFSTFAWEAITATAYSPALESLVNADYSTPSPFVTTFTADDAAFVVGNAVVDYQPLIMDDPNTTKQFQTLEFRFQNITGGSITVSSRYDAATDGTQSTIASGTDESAVTLGVPRAHAINTSLRPGFALSGANAQSSNWELKSTSVRWVALTEEGAR